MLFFVAALMNIMSVRILENKGVCLTFFWTRRHLLAAVDEEAFLFMLRVLMGGRSPVQNTTSEAELVDEIYLMLTET